jgi:putative oxidoreductase
VRVCGRPHHLLVPLSGIIALIGGLSVLFGFQTRLGAGLLVIFLVPSRW